MDMYCMDVPVLHMRLNVTEAARDTHEHSVMQTTMSSQCRAGMRAVGQSLLSALQACG